jgi:hypothetical protein
MEKVIRVNRVGRGVMYVNGVLMRTRCPKDGDVNNRWAAGAIMADIVTALGGFDYLPAKFDATVTVSDTQFVGGTLLTLTFRAIKNNWFNEYTTPTNGRISLPCPRWFKKLTDMPSPEKLWMKLTITRAA